MPSELNISIHFIQCIQGNCDDNITTHQVQKDTLEARDHNSQCNLYNYNLFIEISDREFVHAIDGN